MFRSIYELMRYYNSCTLFQDVWVYACKNIVSLPLLGNTRSKPFLAVVNLFALVGGQSFSLENRAHVNPRSAVDRGKAPSYVEESWVVHKIPQAQPARK